LSVFVTWLNLITISPWSQAATADVALNANVMDSAVLSRNFIFSSVEPLLPYLRIFFWNGLCWRDYWGFA
jgi:hypothetical protein